MTTGEAGERGYNGGDVAAVEGNLRVGETDALRVFV